MSELEHMMLIGRFPTGLIYLKCGDDMESPQLVICQRNDKITLDVHGIRAIEGLARAMGLKPPPKREIAQWKKSIRSAKTST